MIIVTDYAQGSAEWFRDGFGAPSGSQIKKIVTAAKKQLSAQRHDYADELIAERILRDSPEFLQERMDSFENYAMKRGKVYEDEARSRFELLTGLDVTQVGRCWTDDRRVSCSPDGLVLETGRAPSSVEYVAAGLELKYPAGAGVVMGCHRKGGVPSDYIPQVQACLWVTGLPCWYFAAYYPGLPMYIHMAEPDPEYQAALDVALPAFCDELDERQESMK